MADAALIAKFGGKKRPPKFADEGPPNMDDSARGAPSGAGMENPSMESGSMSPGDAGGVEDPSAQGGYGSSEQTLDDLSDILGVGPEDRQDFANSLKEYVHSCIEEAMSGGGASEGEMPAPDGGVPAQEAP